GLPSVVVYRGRRVHAGDPSGDESLLSECVASATPRGLNRGDIDLLHGHHRLESAPRFLTPCRERFGQNPRRDLPGHAPLVLAPAARAFLATIADDRVPVAIGLFLIVGRDLE